nr:hypothetical protein [Microvirgula aerodenitrificans]
MADETQPDRPARIVRVAEWRIRHMCVQAGQTVAGAGGDHAPAAAVEHVAEAGSDPAGVDDRHADEEARMADAGVLPALVPQPPAQTGERGQGQCRPAGIGDQTGVTTAARLSGIVGGTLRCGREGRGEAVHAQADRKRE